MLNPRFFHPVWLSLLLTTILVGGGCDNTIEPFSEKGAYAVHGYLDLARDRQFLRVKRLPVPLTKVGTRPLEATVTLANLDEDTSVILRDSIVTFKDANTSVNTHAFWTDYPITPRTRYRLSVEGPYGAVNATATTPTGTPPTVTPRQGGCRDTVTVVFREMKSLRRHRASVAVKPPNRPWVFYHQRDSPRRGYNFGLYETEKGWLALTFIPENLVAGILNLEFPELPPDKDPNCWDPNVCYNLKTTLLKVWYLYLGSEWYGNVPKDSITYDPLESYDVTGGLGFFGGAVRDWVPFTVETTPKFFYTGGRRCPPPPGS